MKKGLKILSISLLLSLMVACNRDEITNTNSSIPQTSESVTSNSSDEKTSSISSNTSSSSSSSSSSEDKKDEAISIYSEVIASDLQEYDIATTDYNVGTTIKISKGVQLEGSGKQITTIKGESVNSVTRIKNIKEDKPIYITIEHENPQILMHIAPGGKGNRSLIIEDEAGNKVYEKPNEGSSDMFTLDTSAFGNISKQTYKIYGTNGYNLYYLGVKQEATSLGKETGFEINTSSVKKDYLIGDELDFSNLEVSAIYEVGAKLVIKDGYTIDSSKVDLTKSGTYSVDVKYKEFPVQSFEITIHEATKIVSYSDFLFGNKVASRFKKVYNLNEVVNTQNIVVKVGNDEYLQKVTPTFSTVDTSTVGEKDLTISYQVGEKTLTDTIKITVIDKSSLQKDEDGSYLVVVDKNSTESEGSIIDNKLTFKSIQNALDFYENAGLEETSVKKVEIKDGTYKEKVYVEIPNVEFTSASVDASKVVIEYDAIADTLDANGLAGSTYGSSTVTVHGNNFKASNITFKNSAFTTMEEYNTSTANNKQACAIVVDVDAKFSNCVFKGFQDTLYAREGNQIYEECDISGMTDYIFGETSSVYLKNCEITSLYRGSETNGGYICVTKEGKGSTTNCGFFFEGCNIKGEQGVVEGTISLARPWGSNARITYANCTMDKAISKKGYGDQSDTKNCRFEVMSGISPELAEFNEYNNTGEGAISTPVKGGNILTEEQYTALLNIVNSLFNK